MTLHLLVTGGTGFVGGHLIGALRNRGDEVTVLTRAAQLPARLRAMDVGHVASLQGFAPARPVDAVFNLAGARILGVPWTAARRRTLLESRVGTTQRLVEWIGRQPVRPRALLSASAVGYYGVQRGGDDTPLDESAPSQPIFMSTLCQDWERAASAATVHGVAVSSMRFGVVFGKDGGALPAQLLPIRVGLGGPLGGGRQWNSWIHVDDLVAAALHVLDRPPAPNETPGATAWNFTAPEAVRQIDFTRAAAKLLHRPAFLPAPALPIRLALGEQAELLTKGQRVVPKRLLDDGFAFRFGTLDAALRDLLGVAP